MRALPLPYGRGAPDGAERACVYPLSHFVTAPPEWEPREKRIATPVCGLVRNDSSSIGAPCLFETAPFSLEIRVKSGRPMAAPTGESTVYACLCEETTDVTGVAFQGFPPVTIRFPLGSHSGGAVTK